MAHVTVKPSPAPRRKRSLDTASDTASIATAQSWIVTDGAAGNENQAVAVAEAVGIPFAVKRVRVEGGLRLVPPRLQIYVPPGRLLRSLSANEPLEAPWPRLVISVGRRSAPIALAVKRTSCAFALHIQDPKMPAALFDLVAAHVHDGLSGQNVITTLGSVHSVTPARLRHEMMRFVDQIERLPPPRVAVLVGGTSQAFHFTSAVAGEFGRELAELSRKYGASLLVTPSRRTEPTAMQALTAAIEHVPHFAWDGRGENPYFAFLGYADAVVVTQDSVNMVTEAAGTGKPVYIKRLPGYSRRQSYFHALMREAAITRPFDGSLATWTYAPVNDTEIVAAAVRESLGLSKTRLPAASR
jgi:mitochondrial fission protein ELM1